MNLIDAQGHYGLQNEELFSRVVNTYITKNRNEKVQIVTKKQVVPAIPCGPETLQA